MITRHIWTSLSAVPRKAVKFYHSLTSWTESEGAVAGGNSAWWGSSEPGRSGCRRQLHMVRVLWVGQGRLQKAAPHGEGPLSRAGAVAEGSSTWWGSSEPGRGGCRRQLHMVRVLWAGQGRLQKAAPHGEGPLSRAGAVAEGSSTWWGSSEPGRGGCRRQLHMVRVLWAGQGRLQEATPHGEGPLSRVGAVAEGSSTWWGSSGLGGVCSGWLQVSNPHG